MTVRLGHALRYARRVAVAEHVLCAVPEDFIAERRWSRSPETFDLNAVERWVILRAWAKGASDVAAA